MVYRVSASSPENSYTPVKTLGNAAGATPGGSIASGRTLASGRSVVGTTGALLRSQFRVGAAVAAKTPSHTRTRSCGATRAYKTRSMGCSTLLGLLIMPCVARIKKAEATDVWGILRGAA